MLRKRVSLLLVKHEPSDIALIRGMLGAASECDFEIMHAATLAAALLQLRYADVLITDLDLPDSQGVETLRRLRDAAPGVPIVVFTGKTDTQTMTHARHLGVSDYFTRGSMTAQQLISAILRQGKTGLSAPTA